PIASSCTGLARLWPRVRLCLCSAIALRDRVGEGGGQIRVDTATPRPPLPTLRTTSENEPTDRFRTNRIDRAKHDDGPHPEEAALEGWPRARSRLRPSFETSAHPSTGLRSALPQDEA